jgi:cell division protein FtsB
MNKSAKPLILYSLAIFILLSVFLTGYIGVKLKYDQLTKEKVRMEEAINTAKNRQLYLTARMQYYTSEDRIVEIAINELGLIRRVDPRIVLEVSKEKIEMISNNLKEKYD